MIDSKNILENLNSFSVKFLFNIREYEILIKKLKNEYSIFLYEFIINL